MELFLNTIFRQIFQFLVSFFILNFRIYFNLSPAFAEVDPFLFCQDSSRYIKDLESKVQKLENKSKGPLASKKEKSLLLKKVNLIEQKVKKNQKNNLMCRKEGLPQIIITREWKYANSFLISSILFFYIVGWIGWIGRGYILKKNNSENPFTKEIILDFPLAVSFIFLGFLWPFFALMELINGNLLLIDQNVKIS